MDGTIRIEQVETSAHKAEIARLLYEKDSQFVPVTPLATLNDSTTFLMATMDGQNAIRAASSYEAWLGGCSESMALDCDVYELASSIVRSPMGGFEPPSKALHHVLTFARLVNILAMYLSPEASGKKASVIAAIAAGNSQSQQNMKAIGMVAIDSWPRWLDYEHRAWFPKLTKEARQPEKEAVYLWFPPEEIKNFMLDIEPYVTGKKLLEREKQGDPSIKETYAVRVDELTAYEDLLGHFDGSLETAVKNIPYTALFTGPPDLAKLRKDYDDQPDREIVF